jgi:tripartite-type tricarboxylate transporter receptor subunit TctC
MVANGTKEGVVSISESRKSRSGTPPTKIRRVQRRPVNAAYGRLFRVNATEFARRRFLHLAAGAAALPAASRIAKAQAYPTRPVRLILGYAPGNAPDIVARLMGQWLSERLGQPFVIENRPGAGSNFGTEAVVRAAPDGYRLLYSTTANATNATLYDKLNFNFIRDIAAVGGIIRVPNLVAVNPSLSVKSIPQLIAYAKANPGKLNFGAANGGTVQLSGELFKMISVVEIVHVPYRNQAQAAIDLIAGHMQVSFDAMPTTIEYVRAGQLRALAVTTAMRSEALPDIPTVGEFVPGYEASSWHGVGVPKNTPTEIIEKLNKEINAGLLDPKLKAQLADLGAAVFPSSPAEFGEFIAKETEKWAKVIRAANIKMQ